MLSVIIFAALFVTVWLLHKPFDVHSARPLLVKLHEGLEIALIAQFMIMLNELLKKL